MAIQNRRGVFANFDPSRLLPGEWAIVLSGDTSTSDGKAVYVCFAAGDVKRVATYEDLYNQIWSIEDEISQDLTDIIEAAAQEARDAAAELNDYGSRMSTIEEWAANHVYRDAQVDGLLACCEQVRSDIDGLAQSVAALTGNWQYANEGLYAPNAQSFTVSGTNGTIIGL